jgi:hypothetical protein
MKYLKLISQMNGPPKNRALWKYFEDYQSHKSRYIRNTLWCHWGRSTEFIFVVILLKEIIKTSRSLFSFWSRDYWWWTIVWSNITLILSDLDEIFRRIRDSKKKKKKVFLHLPLCTWYVSCINNPFPLHFMWQYILYHVMLYRVHFAMNRV